MDADEYLRKFNSQLSVMSGASKAAMGALNQLEASVRSQQSAVSNLEAAYKSAAARAAEAQKAAVASPSAKTAEALKAAQGAQSAAGAKLGAGRAELDKLNSLLPRFQQQVDLAAQKSEAFGARFQQALSQIPGWAGKVAAAILAVVTAVVAATVAMMQFVIATADAARSARLLDNAAAGGVVAGAELSAVISDVASKVPLSRDKIAEMGRALELAHLQGRRMQNALEAMGIVASAVGPQAASKLEEIATRAQKFRRFWIGLFELEGTGLVLGDVAKALGEQLGVATETARKMILSGRVSVDQGLEAMAAATRAKFGATVAAQMLALDVQLSKMRENFKALFGGLNLEPLLRGLKMVTSLLDQNTVTGRTLKMMVEKLFNPLLEQGSVVFPAIRAFLQGIVIGVLLLQIAILKIKKGLVEAFGGESRSAIDWVKLAMYAGIGLVGALTAAFALLTVAIVALGVAAFFVFFPVIATMMLIAGTVYLIVAAIRRASAAIGGIDLSAAASNMVNTFVNGIRSKLGDVVSAMAQMGGAAAGALKSALGIASPSKVAVDAANNVTSSFATTVEAGTGDTKAAFSGMVEGRAGGGGGGTSAPIVINITYDGSREDFPDFETRVEVSLRAIFERIKGGGLIPAGT